MTDRRVYGYRMYLYCFIRNGFAATIATNGDEISFFCGKYAKRGRIHRRFV